MISILLTPRDMWILPLRWRDPWRVDGVILVLCSVSGVQSQSITVDQQMKRYQVPRIAFVNKCDRSGANPYRVAKQLRDKLGHNPVLDADSNRT